LFKAGEVSQILIIGKDNAVRSQMLEGYLKAKLGHRAKVYSCGIEPSGVDPQAIRAMAEDKVVIAGQTSDDLKEYSGHNFDHILVFDEDLLPTVQSQFPNTDIRLLPIAAIEGFGGLDRLAAIRELRGKIELKSNELIAAQLS
jgi:protein-tyrosine-phosphatase